MSSLADALNGLVAESVTADLSDSEQRTLLVAALRARTPEMADRHALRAWLSLLARWIDTAQGDVPADILSEALLAAATWAGGDNPLALGLENAIDHVLVVSGIADRREAWLSRLMEEAQDSRTSAAESTQVTQSIATAEPADLVAEGNDSLLSGIELESDPVAADAFSPVVMTEAATTDAEIEPQLSTADGPIYIAPEESQMLLESLHGELLPGLVEFSISAAPREPSISLMFLLQAQGNAFDVLGLEHSARVLKGATEHLERGDLSDDALALLADWLVQMGELLQASEGSIDQAAESGASLATVLEIDAQLAAECARVRIAIDPSYTERPRRAVNEGDLDLTPAEDVIPSVLRGMLQELPQNADGLASAVERLRAGERGEVLTDARRFAHTLKGDANTVGIRGLANLTHALEDILVALTKQDDVPHAVLNLLSEAADTVAAMSDAVLGRGESPEAGDVLANVYRVADALERGEPIDEDVSELMVADDDVGDTTGLASAAQQALVEAHQLSDGNVPEKRPEIVSETAAEVPEPSDEQVTISRRLLDRLLEQSAESVALSNQMGDTLSQLERAESELRSELSAFRTVAQALDEQVTLRAGALDAQRRRNEEIDALELDNYNELDMLNRRVTEVQADLQARCHQFAVARVQIETLARRKQVGDELVQSTVRQARLVRLSELTARFQRAARQTARQLSKSIDFRVVGDEIAIDKTVLEGLVEPLMHLIRNAIDHGVEEPALRSERGKPPAGQLELSYSVRGQSLLVRLRDDGGGIDHARVRQRALALGIAGASEADAATLRRYLLLPGFTTRNEVTQTSGRGVGLDIVAARVQRLGGTLNIESEENAGTGFSLALPLSIGNLQVAIIRIGQQRYCFAADSIERLVALTSDDQRGTEQREVLIDGQWHTAIDVSAVVGGNASPTRPVAALLRGSDGVVSVMLLPEVESLATIVIKPLSDYLPTIMGIRGATLLGDGSVAPVVDLRELIGAETIATAATMQAEFNAPLIVVADDSLTIRQSLSELLIDTGFRVELARDGLEALIAIERSNPSALLVDLEMPRMNGLELTQHLRQSERFAALPIVMITSRSSDKHRDLATQAGVSALLGKPYSDEDVIGLLTRATA